MIIDKKIMEDILASNINLKVKKVYTTDDVFSVDSEIVNYNNIYSKKLDIIRDISDMRNLILELSNTSNWKNIIIEPDYKLHFYTEVRYNGINFFIDYNNFPSTVIIGLVLDIDEYKQINVELTDGTLSNYEMFGC